MMMPSFVSFQHHSAMASSFFDQTAGTVRVNTSKNKVEDVVSSLQSEGYEVEVNITILKV
jgi:tRNA G26 N,N-dimethylase Trm1